MSWSLRSPPRPMPIDFREPPPFAAPPHGNLPQPRTALLLNPFYAKDPHASFGKHVLTPSLALTSVAGATPPEWGVRYWDENLLQGPPPIDPLPAVVGISVHLTFAQRAFALAAYYRKLGCKVIFGGLHVLSCPDECAPHADALVFGEGAQVWPTILRDVECNQLRKRYDGSYAKPYREDPTPRRELLDRRSFLTTSSLIATRGCHNRCGFCYLATDGLRMPYLTLRPEQVVEQWSRDDQPYAVFIDNNLGSKPDYLLELCKAIEPMGRIWSAAVTLDVTDRPDVVRAMALSGCTGVFIGFESVTDRNILDARKKSPRVEDYLRRTQILHDNGIQVNGSFVLGFDQDDESCFEKTVEWIERARLECATFHILTPYPGTPLFKQMKSEDRLLHEDWSKYDTSHVVFRPNRMSVDALQRGYEWCYRRLFSHASIWKRRPADLRAVPSYLAMSYLYKRSNWLWPWLIRKRLTHIAWRPLIELSRKRHLSFRKRLAKTPLAGEARRSLTVVSAGV